MGKAKGVSSRMWNSLEKLWRSFFHYSDVRRIDYPGPLITFPSASERPVTLPCGKKSFLLSLLNGSLCSFPPAACHSREVLPGGSIWKVTLIAWDRQGVNALPLGKGDVWEKTQARLCLSLQDELISAHDTVWSCGGGTTPPLSSCHPKSGDNSPGMALASVLPSSVLIYSGSYSTLGHFWSHLCSCPCSHELLRFGPRTSGGKGMFPIKPWEGAEIRASLHVLLLCFPEMRRNRCVEIFKIKTGSQT